MKYISESLDPKKFPILFISLITFIIGAHLLIDREDKLITNILITFVVAASAFTINKGSKFYKLALIVAALLLSLRWMSSAFSTEFTGIITLLFMKIYFIYIVFGIIHFLVKSKKVNLNVILGLISAYLMIGILFSFFFTILVEFNPNALSFPDETIEYADILYYTMISYTTIGYGDILPLSSLARMISYLAGVVGQMYMGIITAILVGKFLQK